MSDTIAITAAPGLGLALESTYRSETRANPELTRAAARQLRVASDALTLAVLNLAGDRGDTRADKEHRAVQARSFLVEAVTALSRARIYVPKIRTYALPVVMTSASNPDSELGRLHQIATRLLWKNHAYLPARLQAKPLPPDEEAQLAVLFQGLARSARIDRAVRHKWLSVALGAAALGPLLGFPFLGAALAALGVALWVWQLNRADRDAPDAVT